MGVIFKTIRMVIGVIFLLQQTICGAVFTPTVTMEANIEMVPEILHLLCLGLTGPTQSLFFDAYYSLHFVMNMKPKLSFTFF